MLKNYFLSFYIPVGINPANPPPLIFDIIEFILYISGKFIICNVLFALYNNFAMVFKETIKLIELE